MKKRIIISLVVSLVLMFLPLYLTVNYVGGNDGMGVLLILFFVLNPILSLVLGIVSGKNFKKFLFIPILNAVFYLVSAWVFLDPLNFDFIPYALVYALIGIITSAIRYAIIRKKQNDENKE